ncbi:MAG TPA: hypothetical protein VMV29_20450 [Ktedonobacterales bacterium]|nr:hypothetical protein [Ktedonobacterales bacterium]
MLTNTPTTMTSSLAPSSIRRRSPAFNNLVSDRTALVTLAIILVLGATLLLTEAFLGATLRPMRPMYHGGPMMSGSGVASSQVTLTIVPQLAGASIQGPAYTPTNFTLPAHSLVTITIVNRDVGDTALPAASPYAFVSGVVGGVARVDGRSYNLLDVTKVAHTFSIPQLNVNVPIPGDTPQGQHLISVTFSFRTGGAGSFMWRCMDPCGSDPVGWGGTMASMGYMMGVITVR